MLQTVRFNQDHSCIAVGYEESYKIFNCDPFGECSLSELISPSLLLTNDDEGGVSLIEMLFQTSLIAIVGLGDSSANSTRRLKIINTKRRSIICELNFSTPILSIKLNRKRLIVILFDQIFVYDISCMKLLHTIETCENKLALGELSCNDDSILCYPSANTNFPFASQDLAESGASSHSGASSSGFVVLFNALDLQPISVIQAHKSPLQCIQISKDGKLLATASVKGTIVRVFDCLNGKKVFEFRRGSIGAKISCLSFSSDNSLLCCSSDTGTIHIFQLTEPHVESSDEEIHQEDTEARKKRSSSLSSLLWTTGSITKNVADKVMTDYLPSKVSSILEPKRHFAFIKLPNENQEESSGSAFRNGEQLTRSYVCINDYNGQVQVVTMDGNYYVYQLPSVKTTECVLLKQYKLK